MRREDEGKKHTPSEQLDNDNYHMRVLNNKTSHQTKNKTSSLSKLIGAIFHVLEFSALERLLFSAADSVCDGCSPIDSLT